MSAQAAPCEAEIRERVDEAAVARAARRPIRPALSPRSSPAGSGNGRPWPGPWPSSRKVLLLDEPFGALDAKVRQGLRRWLRRLHDEIHVTSVFVTHDQEEALEVADRVVVMNGRDDRTGRHAGRSVPSSRPRSSYGLPGQVNVFHGRVEAGKAMLGEVPLEGHYFPGKKEGAAMVYMRPHELDIELYRNGTPSFPARITRINPAGSIAKVTTPPRAKARMCSLI